MTEDHFVHLQERLGRRMSEFEAATFDVRARIPDRDTFAKSGRTISGQEQYTMDSACKQ